MDQYMVNLASVEEMEQLLQAVISKYDSEGKFGVDIVQDENRAGRATHLDAIDKDMKQIVSRTLKFYISVHKQQTC